MTKKIQCRIAQHGLLTDIKNMEWYSLEHNMTPLELKAWTVALRSDDYKQIDGELFGEAMKWYDDDHYEEYTGYCCLGVLGSICGISDDVLCEDTLLVGKWAETTGMLEEDNDYRNPIGAEEYPHTLQDLLSSMNDDGWSFARIADWIEENLIGADEIRV